VIAAFKADSLGTDNEGNKDEDTGRGGAETALCYLSQRRVLRVGGKEVGRKNQIAVTDRRVGSRDVVATLDGRDEAGL
jgi:hypothetical protein